jgi:hypothetical protein
MLSLQGLNLICPRAANDVMATRIHRSLPYPRIEVDSRPQQKWLQFVGILSQDMDKRVGS